ncbi:MAG: methylated-DNA--[protein]-cysteine S-methyltransferase [Formosimonas sp.]
MRANRFATQNIEPDWFDAVVPAPFGGVGVRLSADKQQVFELTYLPDGVPSQHGASVLAQKVFAQVSEYLRNPQATFDLPLMNQGTAFQNKVWQTIAQVPFGHTLTYQSVGRLIACGSPRAVGGACGANPYPLIVPCHRVVASQGIGGFARHDDGFHVGVKRWLLAHEGVVY